MGMMGLLCKGDREIEGMRTRRSMEDNKLATETLMKDRSFRRCSPCGSDLDCYRRFSGFVGTAKRTNIISQRQRTPDQKTLLGFVRLGTKAKNKKKKKTKKENQGKTFGHSPVFRLDFMLPTNSCKVPLTGQRCVHLWRPTILYRRSQGLGRT
jgi:hypothetical protein